MHGPPPSMRPSSSRQSAACPTVYEGREWTEALPAQEETTQYPQPGYCIPANLWNLEVVATALDGTGCTPGGGYPKQGGFALPSRTPPEAVTEL